MISIYNPLAKNISIDGSYTRAKFLVAIYYIAAFYFALSMSLHWSTYSTAKEILPIWPVAWIKMVGITKGVNAVMFLLLFGTLGAAISPNSRVFRIICFLGLFEFIALYNSFGKINHSYHLWVLTSFLLIFLPGGWFRKQILTIKQKNNYLFLFWACQGIILLTYSMSGMTKVEEGILQFFQGQANAFSPDALSLQVAERLLETHSTTLFGSFFIAHPFIGWPMYLGTLYLETCSFLILFRPSLHKIWAIGLIGMHLGIYLIMGIPFIDNILLLALFFFYSPFYLEDVTPKIVLDLPIVRLFNKLFFHH